LVVLGAPFFLLIVILALGLNYQLTFLPLWLLALLFNLRRGLVE